MVPSLSAPRRPAPARRKPTAQLIAPVRRPGSLHLRLPSTPYFIISIYLSFYPYLAGTAPVLSLPPPSRIKPLYRTAT
eukprot:365309-Chlamydomonas_euryale.AAC.11